MKGNKVEKKIRKEKNCKKEENKTYLWSHAWIPPAIVTSPQMDTTQTGHRKEDMFVNIGSIQRICKLLQLTVSE